MDIAAATSHLLKNYGINPDKRKSQNFLISNKVYKKIITVADLHKDEVVLEIGPGLGFLTVQLLAKAKKVVAVEIDKSLFPLLEKIKSQHPHLEIIKKNILGIDENILGDSYKLVANIPYHLSGKIIRKFLSSKNKPSRMVLLVQKEVGERICAQAGKMSLIALAVQYYGKPSLQGLVKPGSFLPAPKVSSVILLVEDIKVPGTSEEEKFFWQLARLGFATKRKTLAHNLNCGLPVSKEKLKSIFHSLGWSEKIRAQELSVLDWQQLANNLKNLSLHKK